MTAERGVAVDRSTLHRRVIKWLPVFEKAMRGTPKTITVGKRGANRAAQALNAWREIPIEIRQNQYLNHLAEQDHHAIKRRVRPMPDAQSFRCARIVLGGIEAMHRSRRGADDCPQGASCVHC